MSQASWRQKLTIATDWAQVPLRSRPLQMSGQDEVRLTSHNDLLIYYILDHGGNPGLTVLANGWPGLLPAKFFKEV